MNNLVQNEKFRTRLFYIAVAACFITIFVYNMLTPMLSDDMNYTIVIREATSIKDLFAQEYVQYMNWTGRSISHMILRLFVYFGGGSKLAFNVFNSICFTLLTLFMYLNVEGRKKHDTLLYTLIVLLVWIFGVQFAETILWETGACNYLITMTAIMGYITAYRYLLHKGQLVHTFLVSLGMLLLGIWAGWGNENTSGGCILLVLIWTFIALNEKKEVPDNEKQTVVIADQKEKAQINFHNLRPWMICGLIGNLFGFAMMILAPGNDVRASYKESAHSGLVEYAARLLKITLVLKNEFFVEICIFVVLVILLRYQKRTWKELTNMLLFFLLFLATSYALVAAPEPQTRAYFGAGIFLLISIAEGVSRIEVTDPLVHTLRTGTVAVLLVYMFFTYIDSGANLARIYREENERYTYLAEKAAAGEYELTDSGSRTLTVPMLRPDFETKYSIAYDVDIVEDNEYWINVAYAYYFGYDWIFGVSRDEWTEY